MKLTLEQKKDILEKNEKLENIKPILKKEFIGIDQQIDDVMNAIRPFYIFPKSLKRPLVISLWGMTACGKSHLIQRLIELLELQNKFIRFDVGEYTGSDYKLRHELSTETSKVKDKNIIICFDEFQFGRTINEQGLELESNAMRPVWDLLDSGKIYKMNISNFRELYDIMELIEKCIEFGVEVVNGLVVKNAKQYEDITRDWSLIPADFKKVNWRSLTVAKKNQSAYLNHRYGNSATNRKHFSQPFFVKTDWFKNVLFSGNKELFEFSDSMDEARSKIFNNLTLPELQDFIKKNFIDSRWLMSEDDYSQSLIFCIGNIDEAFHMHESSDPDADADIFYEHSLKITIPKIKDALSRRFRMEQIGRLGNNHIIYPAFNKDAYHKIIDKHINIRVDYLEEEFGIKVNFDKSINDLIYKEGVFPSQGVRPLLSTINTVIDSYVSKIISDLILKSPDVKEIDWKFSFINNKHILETKGIGKNLTFEYDVKLNIENLRKTDFSEEQAFTAVHEAGHAIIGCIKGGFLPKEVVSKTASIAEGFCRIDWPDINTKSMFYKHIMTCLGGIEAEKLIFGDDMISAGANSDLKKATTIASQMIKVFGMGNNNYVTSTSIDGMNEFMAIHDKGNSEIHAVKIIKDAEKEVKECLANNKLFLLEVAEYLSNNSKMNTEKFKEIALKFIDEKEINDKDKYYNFRSMIDYAKKSESKKSKYKAKVIFTDAGSGNIKTKSFVLNKKKETSISDKKKSSK